ncbi:MAG: GNAT family N-acetyltransferase [Nitrospiraceae bacterium]|nr:GNAT family N-acetyltransferase [Nitrospiraceae bacterium]
MAITSGFILEFFETSKLPKEDMSLKYKVNVPVTTDHFIELLRKSTLGERRPIDDRACMEGMVKNSNLMVTAWDDEKLIGVARSMTDFHYACYLSDLAVHREYQKKGIGKRLLILTQGELGPKCKLILVAAPSANSYYEHVGLTNNPRCWVLDREQKVGS